AREPHDPRVDVRPLRLPLPCNRLRQSAPGHGKDTLGRRFHRAAIQQDDMPFLARACFRLLVEALGQPRLLGTRMRHLLIQRAIAREIEDRRDGFCAVSFVLVIHHRPKSPPIPLPILSNVSPTVFAAPPAASPTAPATPVTPPAAAAAAAPQSPPAATEPVPELIRGNSAPTPPVSAAPPTAVATPVTTPALSSPAVGAVSGPESRTGKARLARLAFLGFGLNKRSIRSRPRSTVPEPAVTRLFVSSPSADAVPTPPAKSNRLIAQTSFAVSPLSPEGISTFTRSFDTIAKARELMVPSPMTRLVC